MATERLSLEVRADSVAWVRGSTVQLAVPLAPGGYAQAFDAAMAQRRGDQRVDVTVQAFHARLYLLPDAEALSSEALWAAFAESRFADLFGHSSEGWLLRVIAERPGLARLVVALPAALMQALLQSLGSALSSVRIDALIRLDQLGGLAPRFTGAAVDVGESNLLMALFVDGRLVRIRQRRVHPALDELKSALQVEWAALGRTDDLPALAFGPADVFNACEPEALARVAPQLLKLQ